MSKFVVIIVIAAALGWWLENVVEPWVYLKILEARVARQRIEQERLSRIIEGECHEIRARPSLERDS